MDSSDSPPPPHTIHQSVSPPSTHGPLCEPQVPNIAPTAAPPAPPENRPDKGARAGGRRVRGRGQMGRAPLRAGGRRRALGPPTLSGGRLRFGAAGSPALANPLARRRRGLARGVGRAGLAAPRRNGWVTRTEGWRRFLRYQALQRQRPLPPAAGICKGAQTLFPPPRRANKPWDRLRSESPASVRHKGRVGTQLPRH